MPERPNGPLESSGLPHNITCFNCESGETELVPNETPALIGLRIYRCKQCGHVDWAEQAPGKRT
jgi:uncharacterized Zn finger protein